MTIGERIESRRKAVGIKSQSALARAVPMGQSTLNGLIRNPYRWSPHLPAIARALNTSVDYLVGDIDDPDEGAPLAPPPLAVQSVMLPVMLPAENALADMFEGLLLAIDREQPVDAIARELAQLLPTGLSRMQGPLLELPRPPRQKPKKAPPAPPAAVEAPAIAEPAHHR